MLKTVNKLKSVKINYMTNKYSSIEKSYILVEISANDNFISIFDFQTTFYVLIRFYLTLK